MFRNLPNNRKKTSIFHLNPLWILLLPLCLSASVCYGDATESVTNYNDNNVGETAEAGSLRDAIDNISENGTIQFNTADDGTINLLSKIDIKDKVTLDLNGKNVTIKDGALDATEHDLSLDSTVEGNLTLGNNANLTAFHLHVGYHDTGTLNVENGGAFADTEYSCIGDLPNSVGTVNISGVGSKYDATHSIMVANFGTGTLNVENGGAFTAYIYSNIGEYAKSVGTVNVLGTGSSYDAGNYLRIGELGTGTVNVTDGGTFTARLDSYIGHLSGSVGTVNVSGTGSTYDTKILAVGESGNGTVNVEDGGTLTVNSGNGTVNIASEEGSTGTLKINDGTINAATISCGNGNANIDFTNLSGNISVEQSGTGKTILTADNTYTGTTTVSAGNLSLGGSNNSSVTVKNGAKLSGNGSAASVLLEEGGRLSPGNSVGTFSTDTLTMLSGSILDIEVADRTSYDKVIITGDSGSSVATGSIIDLNFTEIGDISQGDSMSIITATQGASALDTAGLVTVTNSTGTYATDYILRPYWRTVNDDQTLFVSLLNNGDYTNLSLDSNGYNIGRALDVIKADTTSGDMNYAFSILDGLSERGTGEALEQLVHTTDQGIFDSSVAVMKNFQNLQLGRLHNQCFSQKGIATETKGPEYSTWVQGFESYLKQNSTDSLVGYQANNNGIALGVDRCFGDNVRTGISFGYSTGKVKGADRRTETDIESFQGGVYGGYEGSINPYFVRGAASFAWNAYSDDRKIEFGEIDRLASSEYNGQQCNISLESGYSFIRKSLAITPIAGIQWNHLHLDDYNETGAQSLNLNVDDQNYDLLQSALGGEIAHISSHPWGGWSCSFYAKWLSDLINDELSLNSSFGEGGGAFKTIGGQSEKQHTDIGGEFSLGFYDKFFISAEGSVDMSKHFRGFSGTTTLRYAF